jgi:hypothetical protein
VGALSLEIFGGAAPTPARGAVGTGGLGGGLPPLGFDATGGGTGLGLVATGGGGFTPNELEGRELAGVLLDDPLADTAAGFFQGTAEPFDGARPGKTATGLADASALMAETVGFGTEAGIGVATTASGAEGGGGGRGGGERAAGAALGFGGTNSR